MHIAGKLVVIVVLVLVVGAVAYVAQVVRCAQTNPIPPLHYGYKPSVTASVALADFDACRQEGQSWTRAWLKDRKAGLKAPKIGTHDVVNACLQQKGYEVRRIPSEDYGRLRVLNGSTQKEALGSLMTTGKWSPPGAIETFLFCK